MKRGWVRPLGEKIREALASVLPITGIVLLLSVTIAPLSAGTMVMFVFGALMLVLGMGLFTVGVDMSMMPMGEGIGVEISKSKRLGLPLALCFMLGALITIAEPDLQVLARQVPSIPNNTLILSVAAGVGLFLAVALVRTVFSIRLSHMLLIAYGVTFLLTVLVPEDFIPVSFDSGGVTTGPITVPFIMAMGIGLTSLRSDKKFAGGLLRSDLAVQRRLGAGGADSGHLLRTQGRQRLHHQGDRNHLHHGSLPEYPARSARVRL